MESVDLPFILDKGSGLFEDYSYTQRRPDIPHAQFHRARENLHSLIEKQRKGKSIGWAIMFGGMLRNYIHIHTYVLKHNDHFLVSSVWHLGSIAYSAVIKHFFIHLFLSLSLLLHFIVLMLIMAVVMTAFFCTYMYAGSPCYSATVATLLSTEWGREMEIERPFSCC